MQTRYYEEIQSFNISELGKLQNRYVIKIGEVQFETQ